MPEKKHTTITLDEKQATSLGFQAAGWNEFRKMLEEKGIKVYTTTNPILPKHESIYWSSHGKEQLKIKSQQKKNDPKLVSSALTHAFDLLSSVKEPQTRRAIMSYVLGEVLGKNSQDVDNMIDNIHKSVEPTTDMLNFLIDETAAGDPELYEEKKIIDLCGYTLISTLRDENVLKKCLQGHDKNLYDELKNWIVRADLDTKSEELQNSLAMSKSMLVDTLQQNLKLLAEDKPVIPIHFVVTSEDTSAPFKPNWEKTIYKEGNSLTNAEIRMAYKLMWEIGDPLITELMKKTVFFHKKTNEGFEKISDPWKENPTMWINRPRSKNKLPYKKRPEEQVQQWVKELRALSNKINGTSLENKEETKTSAIWHKF